MTGIVRYVADSFGPPGPFLAPPSVAPARSMATAGTLGAAVLAMPSVAAFLPRIGDSLAMALVVTATTALLSFVVLRWASGGGSAIARTIAGSIVAGAANCSLLLLIATRGAGISFIVVAMIVGAAYGLLFGGAFLPLALALRRHKRSPSHAGRDSMLVRAGGWLAGATVVALALNGFLGNQPLCPVVTKWLAPLTLTAAVVAIASGASRSIKRRRWLVRVLDGKEPSFAVVPRASADLASDRTGDPAMGLVPLQWGENDGADLATLAAASGVLVRRTHDSAGPYRSNLAGEPIALVPLQRPATDSSSRAPRMLLVVLMTVLSLALATTLALMTADATRDQAYSDVGVPSYRLAASRVVNAYIVFLSTGPALLWLIARTLGRRKNLAWRVGVPLIALVAWKLPALIRALTAW